MFLFPDTSIYPTLECCTAEPANSDGPGTTGAIKSDISNGKVNSVFQMHFLEDGGSRGFRHWKWQRLAPSLCLWNALMNFTLFPVITNKQEALPRGCAWHAVRSEHPLHLQSGCRSEQCLVLMMHLFKLWLELPSRQCWCFCKTLLFPRASSGFSFWHWQKPSRTNNVNVVYGVGLAACNSVPCQLLISVHPFSISKH